MEDDLEVRRLAMRDGFDLTYRVAGQGDEPPLLICHGLGSNHIQFEADARYFARHRRVILPDMRGHGDTASPPDPSVADFTCRKLAEDLSQLLDHLDVQVVDVIGNSLGGDIAWELIDLRPGLVRSLATFGTTYQLKVPRAALLLRDAIYLFKGKHLAEWAAKATSKTPHGQEVLTRTFSRLNRRTSKLVGPNICRFDYRPVLERFSGRVLLLQCTGDDAINRALGPTLDALARHPRAEVQAFATGGHCANVDDPDEFRRRIEEFLERVSAREESPITA